MHGVNLFNSDVFQKVEETAGIKISQPGIQRKAGGINGNAFQLPDRSPVASGHLTAFLIRGILPVPVIQISSVVQHSLGTGEQKSHAAVCGKEGLQMSMAGKSILLTVDNPDYRTYFRIELSGDIVGKDGGDILHTQLAQLIEDTGSIVILVAVAGQDKDGLCRIHRGKRALIVIEKIIALSGFRKESL